VRTPEKRGTISFLVNSEKSHEIRHIYRNIFFIINGVFGDEMRVRSDKESLIIHNFKRLRVASKTTQAGLDEKLNLRYMQTFDMENGRKNIKAYDLPEYCLIFGCNILDFFRPIKIKAVRILYYLPDLFGMPSPCRLLLPI